MMNVVSVLVENKHGALLRVAGVLAAVGINIERLAVCPTSDPGISRITIAFDFDQGRIDLLVKKIERLVHVLRAERLAVPETVSPELWQCACRLPSAWEAQTTAVPA